MSSDDPDFRILFCYDGDVYSLGSGPVLLCFLDEVEAKYKWITVMEAWVDRMESPVAMTINGRCEEELIPGSQNRGQASQFAWVFRCVFKKCVRTEAGREYGCSSDLD